MNEWQAQNQIARYVRGLNHEGIIPNVHFYGWESDLVSVTRAGLVHDFEVKVTRADFYRELKKYENGDRYRCCKRRRHAAVTNGKGGPNYFWFAYPERMIGFEDVPDFAGVIEVNDDGRYPVVRREAPRLHGDKITDRQRAFIMRGIGIRYWNMRLAAARG